jgi:hypothetical protein
MSTLGDRIVEHGPFTEPLRFGGFGDDDELTDYRELNELRDELIGMRAAIAKADRDQCGCLGGILSEWAE